MKKSLFEKELIVGISVLMSITLYGCEGKLVDNSENTTTTVTETETTSEVISETTLETISKSEITNYMTAESFKPVSKIVEEYEFSCKYVENDDSQLAGTVYSDKIFKGKYELNNNKKYEIVVEDYGRTSDSYIQINGNKKDISIDRIEKAAIIDINTADEYKEVVLYDIGPSGDPSLKIFRYDGSKIYDMGSYNGDGSYDDILFDSEGKIIDSTGYIDFIDTQVVSKYYLCNGDTVVEKNVNSEGALDKTYSISKDIEVAFLESNDSNMEDVSIPIENTVLLKEGENIKLIKADTENKIYYVQLSDGRIGYITTQIAG